MVTKVLKLELENLSRERVIELPTLWKGLDKTGPQGFFLTWIWSAALIRTLPTAANLELLVAKDSNEIVGLALTTQTRLPQYRLFVGRTNILNATGVPEFDSPMIEHNGFACAGPIGRELLLALVTAFRQGKLNADELVLPGVSEPLDEVITRNDRVRRDRAYKVSLSAARGPQGAVELLSRNSRQQLRRNLRECSALGALTLQRSQDVEGALAGFEALKEFHIASWTRRGKPHAFRWPFFETFHRELIKTGVEDGSVDVLQINAGPAVLGYLYNFHRNGVVYSYQSGFNPALAHLRPGYVCHALAIEHYANRGASIYDFLAGHNQLKQTFATDTYEMSWYRLRRPTAYFRAEAAIRSVFGIS